MGPEHAGAARAPCGPGLEQEVFITFMRENSHVTELGTGLQSVMRGDQHEDGSGGLHSNT